MSAGPLSGVVDVSDVRLLDSVLEDAAADVDRVHLHDLVILDDRRVTDRAVGPLHLDAVSHIVHAGRRRLRRLGVGQMHDGVVGRKLLEVAEGDRHVCEVTDRQVGA